MTEAATVTTTQTQTGDQGGAGGAGAAGGAAAAPVDFSWMGEGAKPEVSTYIQQKGFKNPAALAEAYMNAERAISTRSFEVPKTDDQASWSKIRNAMGVPETADKYDLGELAKTMNPEALKPWMQTFHKLGIPNAAATELMTAVTAQAAQFETQRAQAFVETSQREMELVKTKWGDSFDANSDLARRGMGKLGEMLGGWPDGALLALEKAIGTERLMNLGLVFGKHTVEAGFVSADGQHKSMTKAQAQSERNAILSTPEKNQALYNASHPQHQAVKRQWAELGNIING
jgi:hypothetical protein